MVKIPARAAEQMFLPNGSNLEIGLSIQKVMKTLLVLCFELQGI